MIFLQIPFQILLCIYMHTFCKINTLQVHIKPSVNKQNANYEDS